MGAAIGWLIGLICCVILVMCSESEREQRRSKRSKSTPTQAISMDEGVKKHYRITMYVTQLR